MSEKKRKGTPLWQISKKFNFAAEKIIPDSFVFCVVLTLVVAVLSLTVCHIGPVELLTSWWISQQPVHTGIPDGPDGCCLCNMCSKPTGFQVT